MASVGSVVVSENVIVGPFQIVAALAVLLENNNKEMELTAIATIRA